MMTAADVIEIVTTLEGAGVRAWLDGGWAVDAAIGRQSRDHDDLDLVLPLDQADLVRRVLAARGFTMIEEERTACFVARDADDRRVDVHTVVFDAEGGGIQRLLDGSTWRYPPEGFTGTGVVAGRAVVCLTPEVQVLCHFDYEPDAQDHQDMRLLAEHFGLRLPPPYGPASPP